MSAIPVKEEDNVHLEWYKEASEVTVDTLHSFVNKLTTAYEHDYGTIVHAMAASMTAGFSAVERSPQGGITGFQASHVMWKVLEAVFKIAYPARLTKFEDMLFPQYEEDFQTITADVLEWLQTQAKMKIVTKDEYSNPNVVRHWQSIVDGVIPFGFKLRA